MRREGAIVGVSDHGGWAMLVTLALPDHVRDRCRVVLKDDGLPGLPHHDESRRLALAEAVAMVETVRQAARLHSRCVLEALQRAEPIAGIALRALPALPPSVAERIASPWANARADGAMFREELAGAAAALGWSVHWIDAAALKRAGQTDEFARAEAEASRRFAPPWNADCRLALAAAFAARQEEE